MKRLIKKSEAYSGFEVDNNYHEVFKNPTTSEIAEAKKHYNSIRGVINSDGIFVWPGEFWHQQLQRLVPDPINTNGFRFAFASDGWEFNLNFKYNLEDVLKMIDDNYSLFDSMGDLSKRMNIGPDKNGEYYNINGYEKLKLVIKDDSVLIFNHAKNQGRLIKKAEYLHCHNCGWDNGDFMYNEDGTLQDWVPDSKTKKFKKMDKNQVYKTHKEFDEKNSEKICPKCGQQELDID